MGNQFVVDVWEQSEAELQEETELRKPKRYRVLLLNDDYTPMAFVVEVLVRYFQFGHEIATELMLQVHFSGKAVCGVFTRDIAETKVTLVNRFAHENEYPLRCIMEPE